MPAHSWTYPTTLGGETSPGQERAIGADLFQQPSADELIHGLAKRFARNVCRQVNSAIIAPRSHGQNVSQQPVGIGDRKASRFVRSRIDRDGLCRWSGRNDRAALGGWSIRSTARTCGRSCESLIAALAPPAAFAAKAATTTIPIVFIAGSIRSRLVSSRALTGRAATSPASPSSARVSAGSDLSLRASLSRMW